MATGQVQVGFFHTQTQPAGQDLWPEPDPFTKLVFFPGAQTCPTNPIKPCQIKAHSVAKSKKTKKQKNEMLDIDFLRNQTVGDTQENPDLNKSETLFFHYKIFPHQK